MIHQIPHAVDPVGKSAAANPQRRSMPVGQTLIKGNFVCFNLALRGVSLKFSRAATTRR